MNNEHNASCPKCGAELLSTGNCLKCGYNVNAGTSVNQVSQEQVPVNQGVSLTQSVQTPQTPGTIPLTQPVEQPKEPTIQYNQMNQPMTATQKYEHSDDGIDESEDIKSKNKRNLILAILNVIVFFPAITIFLGAFSFSGLLLGNATEAYGSSIILIIYVVLSFIALAFTIINVLVKVEHRKIFKIISAICIILYLFGPAMTKKAKEDRVNSTKTSIVKNNMEEKVVLDTEQLKVTQKSIDYDSSYVKVTFSIDGLDKNKYACNSDTPSFRVNKYNMSKEYVSRSSIKPGDNGDCVLSISYYDLNDYSIKDIYQIDLFLGNSIANFTTDSKKTDKELSFLEDNNYLLYEDDTIKMYYNPDYKDYIKVYLVSKISDNYSLKFSNLDFDTPGYDTLDAFDSVLLYDYSVTRTNISYHPCRENLSYFKGHYKIYNEQFKVQLENDIDKTFDKHLVTTKYCSAKN